MHVSPIRCWRPRPDKAATFAAPPYDVFDRKSAAAYVANHPDSFLAIDRPETAFAPDQDMYAPEVYEKAAELLKGKAQDGTLLNDQAPCFYLWRMDDGEHRQTGVVCAASVDDYLDGTIKKHENTTAAKEEDRVRHIRATSAQTGPIFLTYRDNYALDVLVSAASAAEPLYDFTDTEGVRQTVWRVARPAALDAFEAAFSTVDNAYIADGHHRAAATVRVCLERREQAERQAREQGGDTEAGASTDGAAADSAASPATSTADTLQDAPWNSFLAVLFPASQMRILAYNRVVLDTAGLGEQDLLDALSAAGIRVGDPVGGAITPDHKGQAGLFAFGRWRSLELPEDAPDASPVERLDTQKLQELVLAPILGIQDPRRDQRIRFIGGIEGTKALERAAGEKGVAFSLFPTSLDELMAVSDAGLLMPPKSTWFEPKLLSGLFIRRI